MIVKLIDIFTQDTSALGTVTNILIKSTYFCDKISLSIVFLNLNHLNQEFNLPYLPNLIAQKVSGTEKEIAQKIDLKFHQQEYERLSEKMAIASENSNLPDSPSAKPALNDLLVRIRLDHQNYLMMFLNKAR